MYITVFDELKCASKGFEDYELDLISPDEVKKQFPDVKDGSGAIEIEIASETDWRKRGPDWVAANKTSYLFFRSRQEWRDAYRWARLLRRHRGRMLVSSSSKIPPCWIAPGHQLRLVSVAGA